MMVDVPMLVLSVPPSGRATTPFRSRSPRQSKHHFPADAARPRTTAKTGAGKPTVIDVAANAMGNKASAEVGLGEGCVRVARPGISHIAAEVAVTGGALVDLDILQGSRTVKIGGERGRRDGKCGKRSYSQNQAVHAHVGSLVDFRAHRGQPADPTSATRPADRFNGRLRVSSRGARLRLDSTCLLVFGGALTLVHCGVRPPLQRLVRPISLQPRIVGWPCCQV